MKLRVMNLPRTYSEAELKKLFADYGDVRETILVLDEVTQSSKGFGFVTMPKRDEAEAAIAALHQEKVNKNRIRVKEVGGGKPSE